jgi:hypothetical protein
LLAFVLVLTTLRSLIVDVFIGLDFGEVQWSAGCSEVLSRFRDCLEFNLDQVLPCAAVLSQSTLSLNTLLSSQESTLLQAEGLSKLCDCLLAR